MASTCSRSSTAASPRSPSFSSPHSAGRRWRTRPFAMAQNGIWRSRSRCMSCSRPFGTWRGLSSASRENPVEAASEGWQMRILGLLTPAFVAVGLTAAALLLRAVLLKQLDARAQRGGSAELLGRGLRLPSLLWCVVLGLYGGLEAAALPPRLAQRVELLLQVLIILSVTTTAA